MAQLLLIDDDPALIPEQVRQAFPGPRYRVEVAGTGAEGVQQVRASPPDVILLDLRLPDQSGLTGRGPRRSPLLDRPARRPDNDRATFHFLTSRDGNNPWPVCCSSTMTRP